MNDGSEHSLDLDHVKTSKGVGVGLMRNPKGCLGSDFIDDIRVDWVVFSSSECYNCSDNDELLH